MGWSLWSMALLLAPRSLETDSGHIQRKLCPPLAIPPVPNHCGTGEQKLCTCSSPVQEVLELIELRT